MQSAIRIGYIDVNFFNKQSVRSSVRQICSICIIGWPITDEKQNFVWGTYVNSLSRITFVIRDEREYQCRNLR